jgi:hypothetical protein
MKKIPSDININISASDSQNNILRVLFGKVSNLYCDVTERSHRGGGEANK